MKTASRDGRRRIAFVTGTRAEFGLMQTVLTAIKNHPRLELQIIATGMHLSPRHGRTLRSIEQEGWRIDATVPWGTVEDQSLASNAMHTGRAMAGLAQAFERLNSEIVLVAGDRVEAFAAASAAHISGRIVAHVHGGDRALGQVDDALRHAITKLAHVHFPATAASAARLAALGEDRWRIHRFGSPGIDGIEKAAVSWQQVQTDFPMLAQRKYALIVLHPTDTDSQREYQRAKMLIDAAKKVRINQAIIIYPNNDPGSDGIIRCWQTMLEGSNFVALANIKRPVFLGLLREAGILLGNSSSGIIEAASFGTPVIDVGPRQQGRERGANVTNVPFETPALRRALSAAWRNGKPKRFPRHNIYGGRNTGQKIARTLAQLKIHPRLLRKLICY